MAKLSDEEFVKFMKEMDAIKSTDDLDRLVGEMTPEEQEMVKKLESIDLDSPPTEEEQKLLDMLGPGFDKRVAKRTMERMKKIRAK